MGLLCGRIRGTPSDHCHSVVSGGRCIASMALTCFPGILLYVVQPLHLSFVNSTIVDGDVDCSFVLSGVFRQLSLWQGDPHFFGPLVRSIPRVTKAISSNTAVSSPIESCFVRTHLLVNNLMIFISVD